MNSVILFNPRSGRSKHRIPNSILQVGAAIEGRYDYFFVDGNLEKDPWVVIKRHLDTHQVKFFGCTVMPGPQLQQAIPYSKKIRALYPDVIIIWGGYFSANQHKSVLNSGFVDFVINGPGDAAFPKLLDAIVHQHAFDHIQNLIFKKENNIVKTSQEPLLDQDKLPQLPYERLNEFYPLKRYLGKTFLGQRTAA